MHLEKFLILIGGNLLDSFISVFLLDFKHYYIQRWGFVSKIGTKFAYLNIFLWLGSRELDLSSMFVYICIDNDSFTSAVYNSFNSTAWSRI